MASIVKKSLITFQGEMSAPYFLTASPSQGGTASLSTPSSGSDISFDVNTQIGAAIAELSTSDADIAYGDYHSYEIILDRYPEDGQYFNLGSDPNDTSTLYWGNPLNPPWIGSTPVDHKAGNIYTVELRTIDSSGSYHDQVYKFSVSSNDLYNLRPSGISIYKSLPILPITEKVSSFDENIDPGSTIGYLKAIDPDPEEYTYSFISDDEKGPDNSAFSIVGNQLMVNNSPDYETKDSYKIYIRAQGSWGDGFFVDSEFTFSVNDLNEDRVNSVTESPNTSTNSSETTPNASASAPTPTPNPTTTSAPETTPTPNPASTSAPEPTSTTTSVSPKGGEEEISSTSISAQTLPSNLEIIPISLPGNESESDNELPPGISVQNGSLTGITISINESESEDELPPGISVQNGSLTGITISIKDNEKSESQDFLSKSGIILDKSEVKIFQLNKPVSMRDSDVDIIIVGTEKKDKITGSSVGEVLAGGKGKDILEGGDGADGFLFQSPEGFGKKEADKITDFNADQGDSVLVDKEVFDLGGKVKFKTVAGKKAIKKVSKSNKEFVYDDKKGLLYFNANGKEKGWGDNGGLFANLKGAPELDASDFTIV